MLPPNQCSHALRHYCVSELRRPPAKSNEDIGNWIGDTAATVERVYGRSMPGAMDHIAAELSGARDAAPLVLRPDAVRDSCDRGHEYPTDVRRNADGSRVCRICQAENQRRYRARKTGA